MTTDIVCSQYIGWEPLAADAGCHCQWVPFSRQGASVPPTKAGQVLKEYSKSQGVDTDVFEKQMSKFKVVLHQQIKHGAQRYYYVTQFINKHSGNTWTPLSYG